MTNIVKLALLAASMVCLSAQAAVLKLRIMETTDLHMNFLNYDDYPDKPNDALSVNRSMALIKAALAYASAAQKFLPNLKNIKPLKESADGFATFALVP